jgi:hypothetical protein
MRYMMLIYSKEMPGGLSAEEDGKHRMAHRSVITEATEKGVLVASEPLAPISSATTVRMENGKALVTDGPFAETKEQLAGYYIIDCADLEDAKQWAAKIPTACFGGSGCIEIRPLPGLSNR